MRARAQHSDTPNVNMYRNIAIILGLAVFCIASPVPEPDPGYHKTHIKVHIPHEVHTIHHHHVEKIPVIKEVPIIKELPVIKEVPIIKTVPVVETVHVPLVKTVSVEKPVFYPVPVKEHLTYHSSWHTL